jgi:hypothetical protein
MRPTIARGTRSVLIAPIESPDMGPFFGHGWLLVSRISRQP